MNPYKAVSDFEKTVADYAGSKYAVATDSCTNSLFLCLKYVKAWTVYLPNHTYVGVAHSVINAGAMLRWDYYRWEGAYWLRPYPIIDSARRFRKDMYVPDTFYCLSFHWTKHLPIGRGGMILLNDKKAMKWLKRARFDGRTEGVPCKEDKFNQPGYHMYMTPEQASKGLVHMLSIPNYNKDLIERNYPDLSKHKYFGT